MSLILSNLIGFLDRKIPSAYQESYDNVGLLVGDLTSPITGVLVSLDVTESVIDEAIERKCNVIVAHHPLIFKPLKRLIGKGYVEKTIIKAIQKGVAVYAAHTNLDNVDFGVNARIAQKLGLKDVRVLAPKVGLLKKLVVFVPQDKTDNLMKALSVAGAGNIGNYSECSFKVTGLGTFKPSDLANPFIGEKNQLETVEENRLEMIFPAQLESNILAAMKEHHPYEEVAYYLQALDNPWQEVGSGAIGVLESPMSEMDFLSMTKQKFATGVIRHSQFTSKSIKKVALCGGSGSFLLKTAIASQADAFLTADIRYHEFFDAEGKILFADIGHFESEQFTSEIIFELISEKFPNIAVILSSTKTNPVHYF